LHIETTWALQGLTSCNIVPWCALQGHAPFDAITKEGAHDTVLEKLECHETFDIITEEGANELVVDINNFTHEDGNTHSKGEHFSLSLNKNKNIINMGHMLILSIRIYIYKLIYKLIL